MGNYNPLTNPVFEIDQFYIDFTPRKAIYFIQFSE